MRSATKITLKQFSASTKHDLSKVKKTLHLSVFDDVIARQFRCEAKASHRLKALLFGKLCRLVAVCQI